MQMPGQKSSLVVPFALIQVLGLSLALVASGCTGRVVGVKPEQGAPAGEITNLGGKVIVDEKSPDKPVIFVDLESTNETDAGLEHLKGFTKLQRLNLANTKVTDEGLQHLKELANLRRLNLTNTKVIGPGLEHLKGLTQLQLLDLSGTQVTDAGLEHLKGLTNLQMLYLKNTKVSDAGLDRLKGLTNLQMLDLTNTEVPDWGAGMKKLHQALPNCSILLR
jgi:hypothetical protein